MNVLALDLALTSTGIALADGKTWKVTTNAADRLELRLAAIVDEIGEAIGADEADGTPTDLVVIEDFVTASKFAGAVAPVHGAVRLWLWRHQFTVAIVPAKSLKKYATGNGNAGKIDMALAAQKRAGLDFGKSREDECDAWWLRTAALDAYGHPLFPMPAAQRAALEAVAWPVFPTTSAVA